MNKDRIRFIDKNAVKLSSDLYVAMENGRMLLFKKIDDYGIGYMLLTSFSYDDFEKMKQLSEKEINKINKDL